MEVLLGYHEFFYSHKTNCEQNFVTFRYLDCIKFHIRRTHQIENVYCVKSNWKCVWCMLTNNMYSHVLQSVHSLCLHVSVEFVIKNECKKECKKESIWERKSKFWSWSMQDKRKLQSPNSFPFQNQPYPQSSKIVRKFLRPWLQDLRQKKTKRFRKAQNEDLEKELLDWFKNLHFLHINNVHKFK